MNSDQSLGRRIRAHRQRNNLTLKQIEHRSELSATHLSEIERGKAVPTIGALDKIARAFSVDPVELLERNGLPSAHVTRRSKRRRVGLPDDGVIFQTLSGGISGPELSLILVDWQPGGGGAPREPHDGEELGLVLSGRLEVALEGTVYRLGVGESIHFRSDRPHTIQNPGPEPCRALWALLPRFGF